MRKNQAGFTLLECIISMLIFTIVIASFASIMGAGTKIFKKSKEITYKHNTAQGQISEGNVTHEGEEGLEFEFGNGTRITIPVEYYVSKEKKAKYKLFKAK